MGHPDFRVRGKIFATLNYPDENLGMVKLTPEQQYDFTKSQPTVFVPVKGGWGKRGATHLVLRAVKKADARTALAAAWHNVAPKRLAQEFKEHA